MGPNTLGLRSVTSMNLLSLLNLEITNTLALWLVSMVWRLRSALFFTVQR